MASGADSGTNNPMTYTLQVIGGKWKPLILYLIGNSINRFSILLQQIPAISRQVLTNQLRELEADGIVDRTVYPEIPPRVEYSMTEVGESTIPIIMEMLKWGEDHMQDER